jgi:hypothetical protein
MQRGICLTGWQRAGAMLRHGDSRQGMPSGITEFYLPITFNPNISSDAFIAVDRSLFPVEANGDHAFTMT